MEADRPAVDGVVDRADEVAAVVVEEEVVEAASSADSAGKPKPHRCLLRKAERLRRPPEEAMPAVRRATAEAEEIARTRRPRVATIRK